MLGSLPGFLQAQSGGRTTYDFLELVNSSRVAALGGKPVSIKDDDLSLMRDNPSLLSPALSDNVSLTYATHFAGIGNGAASYAHHFDSIATTFATTLDFVNYGKFEKRDAFGQKTGEFRAADYALTFGAGRQLDSLFSVGANLKLIYSALYTYRSTGAALDISGTYHNARRRLTAALVLRNMGYQLRTYEDENREPLPYEVLFGVSKQLKHAPLRITLTGRDLQRWDLTYEDPYARTNTNRQGASVQEEGTATTGERLKDFGDKLMRHIVVSGEVLLTENIHIRMGYDYRRRQELKLYEKPGFIGFSYGVGITVAGFHISYGRASYHLAGGTNHFTVTTDLSGGWTRK